MRAKRAERRRVPAPLERVLPGVLTFAVCLAVWQAISLLFLPVFFPGPAVLVERIVTLYS